MTPHNGGRGICLLMPIIRKDAPTRGRGGGGEEGNCFPPFRNKEEIRKPRKLGVVILQRKVPLCRERKRVEKCSPNPKREHWKGPARGGESIPVASSAGKKGEKVITLFEKGGKNENSFVLRSRGYHFPTTPRLAGCGEPAPFYERRKGEEKGSRLPLVDGGKEKRIS